MVDLQVAPDVGISLVVKILKLPTLVYRRARGDMIETFKLLHDKYYGARPSGNGGTLLLYFALVLLLYSRLSKITTGTI